MMYILTQEEFDVLQEKKHKIVEDAQKILQHVCTKAANEWPIKYWGRAEASPWGCYLTMEANGTEWYCDECPVQDICPYEYKDWSK
jgi:endonuclease III